MGSQFPAQLNRARVAALVARRDSLCPGAVPDTQRPIPLVLTTAIRQLTVDSQGEEYILSLRQVANAQGFETRLPAPVSDETRDVLNEEAFKRVIAVERKRTERTKRPFLLMLMEGCDHQSSDGKSVALDHMIAALLLSTRETDVIGWYKERHMIGVIFTGIADEDKDSTLSSILNRVSSALRDEMTLNQFSQITIAFHFFPEDWSRDGSGRRTDPALYPDLYPSKGGKSAMLGAKRLVDVVVSITLLAALMPILVIIALAVKMTSKGPILFRQQRVGQFGRYFTFLKFRSMRVNCDPTIHKEYVMRLIGGSAERISLNGNSDGVYKLAYDPRITPIGKLLRRTSLDELPQLWNVLRGDMSLIGPRPPIPYELAAYQAWHRRRLLQVRPGITGLWQVSGRSRVSFDDMVRMDLQYATFWSPWLDLKILLRTPGAVVRGAY